MKDSTQRMYELYFIEQEIIKKKLIWFKHKTWTPTKKKKEKIESEQLFR
jgi:hypothetical protein